MREIRCVVADKKLVETLDALDGLTLEPPVVIRAAEGLSGEHHHVVVRQEGRLVAAPHVDLFVANAKKAGAKTINARQLSQHMKMGGFSAHAYSYHLHKLIADKVLKRTKQQGIYEVV